MDSLKYPFKLTELTKIKESFKQHITHKSGGIEAFQVVEKAFVTINELRDSLNFRIVDVNNLTACENMEKIIYQYLKYARELQKKFKFESWQSDRVKITFEWRDSFKPDEVVSTSNLRVEMCAILYNLAILLYSTGNIYLNRNSNEDRKNALKKFRYAIWAISELKRNLPHIFREFKKTHLDFSVQNVNMFEQILYGQAYSSLFLNLQSAEQTIGFHHIASLSGEANKHFQLGMQHINQVFGDPNSQFPKQFMLLGKQFLYSKMVYFFSMTALKMAKHHEHRLDKERQLPHLGIAIAYLIKAKEILALAMKNMENVSPSMQEEIHRLINTINTTYQEYVERNSAIYNHAVPSGSSLPTTHLQEKMCVTFAVPPELEKDSEDDVQFRTLLSPDMLSLLKEVKKQAEHNRTEVSNAIKLIKDSRNKIYMENFVNGYLEMMNEYAFMVEQKNLNIMGGGNSMAVQKQRRFPQTIEQKMNEIIKKGGIKTIQNLISVLDENSGSAYVLISEIIQRIEEEEREDEANRAIYGQHWKMVPSAEANYSYLMRVKEQQENLRDGESIDALTKKRFAELTPFFKLMQSGKEYILSIIPPSENATFMEELLVYIQNIYHLDEQVMKVIDTCERDIKSLGSCIDLQSAVRESQARRLNRQQTINFILGPSMQVCENMKYQFASANSIIDEIANIAVFLNSKKVHLEAQNSIKEIQKVNDGFWSILELFNELEQGIEFYKVLFNAITDLDQEFSDFLTSRLFEKEILERSLQRDNNGLQQGRIEGEYEDSVTAQPFFNDGGFPQGQSKYIMDPADNLEAQQSMISQSWLGNPMQQQQQQQQYPQHQLHQQYHQQQQQQQQQQQ